MPTRGRAGDTGFTLIELLVAVTIILTVAAIGVPMYMNALERARVTRAIGDISSVGKEVVTYQVSFGCWPPGLSALGREDLRDPWGRPYQFAIVSAGAASGGSGSAGNAGNDNSGNANNGNGNGNNGNGNGNGNSGNGNNGRGRGGNGNNGNGNSGGNGNGNSGGNAGGGSSGSPAASGNPTCGAASGQARQMAGDPINRDFDLYSLGKDGQSATSLSAQTSKDDVVRGKGGSFVGLVSSY